jgi:hypothetical protein
MRVWPGTSTPIYTAFSIMRSSVVYTVKQNVSRGYTHLGRPVMRMVRVYIDIYTLSLMRTIVSRLDFVRIAIYAFNLRC